MTLILFGILQSFLMFQSQAQGISQNDFYEHLTELIRAYKRILFAVEDIFITIKTDGDYQPHIFQIKKVMQEQEQLISRYDFSLQNYRNYHSAYQRFICRLVQNIAPIKLKVNSEEPRILLVQQLLSKLEMCINFHRKEKNLAFMFKRIFVYINKFCQGCEMLLSCYSHSQAVESLKRQEEQQRNEGQKIMAKGVTAQPQSNFQKIMGVINKRFVTISCLDLDYNSYKSYCFMSRNDPNNQLYKDLQARNAMTSKAICRYSRHFSEFLKRKQKNTVRKNRMRMRELKQMIKTNEPVEQQGQNINSITLQLSCQLQEKREEQGIVSLPVLKQQKRVLQTEQRKDEGRKLQSTPVRRGHYQMKSIYLTINKCHDKIINSNRFMFNYSMVRQQQETNRKFSSIKVNQAPLKNTQMVNPSALPQTERQGGSNIMAQMVARSKIALSPRVSIIHKASEKKGQKRNIRITNLTFRNHHTRINSLLDPQSLVFY